MRRTPADKTAPTAQALRVVRRLVRESTVGTWSAWTALLCVLAETLLERGAVTVLLALIFLAIAPSPAALERQAPGGMSVDWIQRLGGAIGPGAQDRLHALLLFILLMVVAQFARCACAFGRSYLSQVFAQGLIRDLRQRLYQHLVRQSFSFYKSRETGDLMSRVSNDVTVLQRVLSTDLVEAARAPFAVVISLALMASLSWKLTLFSVACVPAISLIIARSGDRLRRLTREAQARLGTLNAFLQERLSGIETVQLFGMEQRELASFDRINAGNFRVNVRVARVVSVLLPLVDFISWFGMLVLIYVAGYFAIKGPLSLATLIAFGYLAQGIGSKLSLVGKIWLSGHQAAAAGDRVFEILDTVEEVPEAPDAVELPRMRGEIAFRHVRFGYLGADEVLRDVDVTIEAGQVVALVGASGAGKTSMVNLIPRFYDPTAGRIEIDGTDISRVTLRSLRSQIGIVPQDPILFSGSARGNIAYGKPDATDAEVEAAARAANADDFIRELPEGYNTSVGERATKLSGGQKQRIAIARTILRDPRVLILDEATSALDAESEALVQDALERLMQGRTTLVIAHRLSTIQRVDRILVLADGRIAEDGTHEQLLRLGGLYCRLYEAQLQPSGEETPAKP
ncbi:MAG: ABC transporter ATP-binding protein [Armatimonadota bacterium]